MNFEERNEQSKSYQSFRTTLDMGMGAFYVIIGVVVLYLHNFGAIELSSTYAYVLGGIMVAYGGFRIYRGMAEILQKKKNTNSNRS